MAGTGGSCTGGLSRGLPGRGDAVGLRDERSFSRRAACGQAMAPGDQRQRPDVLPWLDSAVWGPHAYMQQQVFVPWLLPVHHVKGCLPAGGTGPRPRVGARPTGGTLLSAPALHPHSDGCL